ncbi:IS66 Orf2 like protein [Caballeronia arationis]|uniref:IS66 family insertion sequence element accessory protein TnpB n=1 Tax=Caballeronia arationis TaxID=1777142 RepID=UPI00074C280D|nr:IS66 Orf2 like protein [Caballeronia arationis]
MIGLPAGTRIWIAAGVTDMRAGFQGLAAKVQTALEENPLICDGCQYVAARHLGIQHIAIK